MPSCPTAQHSRNQSRGLESAGTSLLLPGRPIANPPQVANLPYMLIGEPPAAAETSFRGNGAWSLHERDGLLLDAVVAADSESLHGCLGLDVVLIVCDPQVIVTSCDGLFLGAPKARDRGNSSWSVPSLKASMWALSAMSLPSRVAKIRTYCIGAAMSVSAFHNFPASTSTPRIQPSALQDGALFVVEAKVPRTRRASLFIRGQRSNIRFLGRVLILLR